jgi:hypothetical protein
MPGASERRVNGNEQMKREENESKMRTRTIAESMGVLVFMQS